MSRNKFTIEELCKSTTAEINGIKNIPSEAEVNALHWLIKKILEPASCLFNFKITSGYRCKELNNLVGGAYNSKHVLGEACDVVPTDITVMQAWNILKDSKIPFDQVIAEKCGDIEWIHVSYSRVTKNRRQAFTLGR